MTAVRTQVYLTEELRERIDRVAASTGQTMAEVVRRALDAYLVDEVDPVPALTATFGTVPDATAASRDEWDRG